MGTEWVQSWRKLTRFFSLTTENCCQLPLVAGSALQRRSLNDHMLLTSSKQRSHAVNDRLIITLVLNTKAMLTLMEKNFSLIC